MQLSIITALEIQKRNKERVNLYLDGEFAFGIPLIDAAKLHKGQKLSQEQIDELRHLDAIQRSMDKAVRFLSYRPRSVDEVRRNLIKNETPESIVEIALERLINMGYLDDEAFARFWLENRDMFKPRGTAALRYELRQKGITDTIIDLILSEFDVEDAAYRAAQSKVRSMRGKTEQDFRKKVGSFLQRRGFTYDVCRNAIEQSIQEIVENDPEFFAEREE
ncbi:MAG: RecX family transcriptional regulator [Aggregatilineales bacterium]